MLGRVLTAVLWEAARRAAESAPAWILRQAVWQTAKPYPLVPYPGWRFGVEERLLADEHFRMRLALWNILRRRPHSDARLPWHHGLVLATRLGNALNHALYVGGAFEPNEFAYLETRLRPGMVFVDAGANEGIYTLFAAKKVGPQGRVVAIEPSVRERALLEANIALNRLGNVRVHGVALGEAHGTVELRLAEAAHAGQNTLGSFIYQGVRESALATVPMVTLDELLDGAPRVDFIKLDVEGAELRVLRGALATLARCKPELLIEVSPEALRRQSGSREEVFDLLRGLGYRLAGFDPRSGLPSTEEACLLASDNVLATAS